MSAPHRNDIAPSTLSVALLEEGVEVEYTDGRKTLYRGVPEKVSGSLTTKPGRDLHVLVTDPTESEGVLVYVNDRKTHDDVLESTGVGRVILGGDAEEELFPGVVVRRVGELRFEVEADPETARGRVFAFVEDDWTEESYEFVNADGESIADDDADTTERAPEAEPEAEP
ncbi:DUF5796 family protein [Salinigranum sp. GCM10025319]|uniref:DUF5796 family protein n=1 Tax=Salinigranum sp. GCM10025319 TaxID=3252687 RepID=UPI00361A4981